jgi:DMSO/TMAO reductase YedYZ molybdopterin-dependent catalytic subunit
MTDTVQEPAVARQLPDYNARRLGFTAGVVAAAVMLVAIIVLRLLSGATSLPEIVAEGLLVNMPGALFSAVLDALQHSAKPLFYLAVGIGVLIVGGFLGRWYASQPTWQQALKIVISVWLVFGLGVYTLLGAGLFGQHLQAGALWHGLSLLVVIGVYGVAVWHAYAALVHRAVPAVPDTSRRLFLRDTAAAIVATVGAGAIWRTITGGVTDNVAVGAAATPLGTVPNAPPFNLTGMSPEITAASEFYTVSKNFIDPDVPVGGWRLKIDGLVDRPMQLTYEQLTALPASEGYYTLMCISNEIGGDLWGNAYWRGVKLKYLLEQAGVHTDAVKAIFSGADDYKDSVMLDRALHPDALLAWEMNGEPLKREHGFPARLLIPGIYGMKNVKWLNGITIVANDFRGFWQSQGWDDAAPYQTESRIEVPRGHETVSAGTLPVGGIAYAGDRGIQLIEVSKDGGKTWVPAQVKPGLSPYTWQLWRADLEVDKSVKQIHVRATDGLGHTQTREENPPFPAGATGYHHITIAVT